MLVKIAICDDAPDDRARLTGALLAYDPTFKITAYPSGTELLDSLLDSAFDADLLFLDIFMPGTDGIRTAQEVLKRNREIKIVFLSHSREHYSQAYEVFAFNYIEKPFNQERLYRVLDRAIEELSRAQNKKITFTFKSVTHSVDCRNILFLESRNKLIVIHLTDGTALQCYEKMDTMSNELPEQTFVRCHQSFLVNMNHITEMGDKFFRVASASIGISRRYLKPAKEQYYSFLFHKLGRGSSQ